MNSYIRTAIIVNVFLAILNFYLHVSGRGLNAELSTFLIANIAILSTIVVVCAFVVTVTGLNKIESIKKEAHRVAGEAARKEAKEVLMSEEFLRALVKTSETIYNINRDIPSRPSSTKEEISENET